MTKRIFPLLFAALFAAGLMIYPRECSREAVSSLSFCVNTLLPSLFPFFVLSSFLSGTGTAEIISKRLEKPLSSLFSLPGSCALPFLSGILGGCPVCASAAAESYKSGLCSEREASLSAAFSPGAGISFILGVCPSLFGSFDLCLTLFLSHILSCILCGVLLSLAERRKMREAFPDGHFKPEKREKKPPLSIPSALSGAISDAILSAASVCASVVFFSVALRLFYLSGGFSFTSNALSVLSPFPLEKPFTESLLLGFFELSRGVKGLSALSAGNAELSLSCAAATLGFCGLSVHFQTAGILEKAGLSSRPFFSARLLNAILSLLFFKLLLYPSRALSFFLSMPAALLISAAFLLVLLACAVYFARKAVERRA